MWLHWVSETGQARCHAPEFFVRRADGTGMLIDVRPDNCAAVFVSGVMAQIAACAVGYGERMCCCAAMTTRTAA
jgi:hypothetical protein